MAVVLTINTVTNTDYDDVNETVKEVCVAVDGTDIHEYYTYPDSTADATIQTEVEADLTAKGYTWT